MDNNQLEAALHAAGKDGIPRVTMEKVEAAISATHYFTAADGVLGDFVRGTGAYHHGHTGSKAATPLQLLTFCVLILRNGYTVYGASACAHPDLYDKALGQKLARDDAIDKIWPLLGFMLRESLQAAEEKAEEMRKADDRARAQAVDDGLPF